MIATDHAPHAAEEKNGGLLKSLMGIVGLETAFPLLYTHLVKTSILSLDRLVELMADAPAKRFSLPRCDFTPGSRADITAFDLNTASVIDPEQFFSSGHATPFSGKTVYGQCIFTLFRGQIAWMEHKSGRLTPSGRF